MEKLRNFINNDRKNFIFFIALYTIMVSFFPISWVLSLFDGAVYAENVIIILVRIIFSVFPFICYIAINHKFDKQKGWLLVFIVCFLICLNNFPFVAIILKTCSIDKNSLLILLHLIKCFSISLFEELIFRAIILTLFIEHFSTSKNCVLKSVIYSSLIFGLVHLVNLFFGGEVFYVFLQVGYSFLVGVLFSLAYLLSGKFIIPIILHFIYNVGGLLQESQLVFGVIWPNGQLIFTAVIAVVLGSYLLYELLKLNKNYKIGDAKDEGSGSKSNIG